MSSFPGMVAGQSPEDFVAEDVDGLSVPAVAHRRGQSDRDSHSTSRTIPLRSHEDLDGLEITNRRTKRRSGSNSQTGFLKVSI